MATDDVYVVHDQPIALRDHGLTLLEAAAHGSRIRRSPDARGDARREGDDVIGPEALERIGITSDDRARVGLVKSMHCGRLSRVRAKHLAAADAAKHAV